MSFLSAKSQQNASRKEVEYSLEEYLNLCKTDRMAYASAAERLLAAIGEPAVIDTSKEPRLARIFQNRTIRTYAPFSDFYGIEDTIERLVNFIRSAAQGTGESRKILHMLGPVGSAKSTLAERLKALMETYPIYVLCANGVASPVFESPLGLFDPETDAAALQEEYGIPLSAIKIVPSPWALKRLAEFEGDINKFTVRKMWPSRLKQIAVSRTEPGDANTSDVTGLIGKCDIRQLEHFSQNDPDSYSYSGGLNRGNQGLCECVEIFKAQTAVLNPLLAATQENHYAASEPIGQLPWSGMLLSHCFSEDTEILTKTGWKNIDTLEIGDLIATMRRDTREVEFHPAQQKIVRQAVPHEMYHFKSSAMNHLMTSDHTLLVKAQKHQEIKEILVKDFHKTGYEIPLSAIIVQDDLEGWSDDEIRALVWVVADGSIQSRVTLPNYARFHLGKARKIERLLGLCARMKTNTTIANSTHKSKNYKNIQNIYVEFDAKILQKTLPSEFVNLSPRQIEILLTEWAHTDGTIHTLKKNGKIQQAQLYTNNTKNKDLIQYLCAISGRKSCAWPRHLEGYEDVWSIHIQFDKTFVRADNVNKGVVSYEGRVWCVTVQNHTVFARRQGKVIITGNCNFSENASFTNNKKNEAFVDRMGVVKVPYTLRVTEEAKIYEKMLRESSLANAPLAPHTLNLLARFSVLSRLEEHQNSTLYAKLCVYDGQDVRETEPRAKSLTEYKDAATENEGTTGISTRFAMTVLASVFNYDASEVAADPIHLFVVLRQAIERAQFPQEQEEKYLSFVNDELESRYAKDIEKDIQTCYVESYATFGQNLFDRYVQHADAWMENADFRDPDTGTMLDRSALNDELSKVEKAAGIGNPKDFRSEVVRFCLRYRANNGGNNPDWRSYEKIREVIEAKMFGNMEDLLPVISFGAKQDSETAEKHQNFLARMMEKGYTEKQVRRVVEWFARARHSQ